MTPGQLSAINNRRASLGLRQVATRCYFPGAFTAANKEAMSVSGHFARDNIAAVQYVFTGDYADTAEHSPGSDTTVTAAHEWPIALTSTPLTFGGSSSGTIPNGGFLVSDLVPLPRQTPKDAMFRARVWRSNASGIVNCVGKFSNALMKDSCALSTTTQTDTTTLTTTPTDNAGGAGFMPCAILAYTREESVFISGDSREVAVGDTIDASGDVGQTCRSVGKRWGYIRVGASGTKASDFNASHALRLQLAAYCTKVLLGYDINGCAARNIATVKADFATLWALFPNHPVWQCTMLPYATSSNNWQDFAGQTLGAVNADPLLVNDFIMSVPRPLKGAIDIALPVTDPANRGFWRYDGTANKYVPSGDTGAHGTQFAYQEIERANLILPQLLRR